MTEREPFATVFKYGINIGGVECFSEEPDDREVAKAINAAFNARVDADVKNAVGEFRESVLDLARSDSNCTCRGAEEHYKGCPQLFGLYLCAKIRALPTGPEVEK